MPLPFLPLLGAASLGMSAVGMLGRSRRSAYDDDESNPERRGGGLSGLAMLASKSAGAATALGMLAAAAPATVRAFEGFSAVLLSGRKEYSRLSGSIGGAFARLERQQLLRSYQTAQAIGPGTVSLAKAYDELQVETREFTERRLRFGNVLGTVAARAARALAGTLNDMFGGPIDKILDYLEELVGIGKGGSEPQKEWRDYFRRLRDGQPMNKRPGGRD